MPLFAFTTPAPSPSLSIPIPAPPRPSPSSSLSLSFLPSGLPDASLTFPDAERGEEEGREDGLGGAEASAPEKRTSSGAEGEIVAGTVSVAALRQPTERKRRKENVR